MSDSELCQLVPFEQFPGLKKTLNYNIQNLGQSSFIQGFDRLKEIFRKFCDNDAWECPLEYHFWLSATLGT